MQHHELKIKDSLSFNKNEILPIIITSNSSMKGNMISDNSIRIEGEFLGKMFSKRKIIIDDNAIFCGNIIAEDVDISGKVNGNIYCSGKVILKNGAEVIGTIYTTKFKNELGSKFDNNLKLLKEAATNKIFSIKDEIKINISFFESNIYNKLIERFSGEI
jgi:cytoskeletal protein CcmA (bactofilin family)